MYTQNLNCLTPPEKIFLPDGTELRLCVGAVARQGRAKLYCSSMGIFYSLSRRGLNPVKCRFIKNFRRKPNVHSYYPRMSGFRGAPYCHLLVAVAWIGPRPTFVVPQKTGSPTQTKPKAVCGGEEPNHTSPLCRRAASDATVLVKAECHHLNGDLTDNRASNLIWLTHEEHLRYDAALRVLQRGRIKLAGDVYEGD